VGTAYWAKLLAGSVSAAEQKHKSDSAILLVNRCSIGPLVDICALRKGLYMRGVASPDKRPDVTYRS
jgi:hypothetical protein